MTNRHRHVVVIGGQRCGTTYLAEMLGKHPEVEMAMPAHPEPKFFLRPRRHLEYDQALFSGERPLLAEKSTSYLDTPEAADHLIAAVPDARIICIVRDPVDRALSNYRFSVDNGLEHLPPARPSRSKLKAANSPTNCRSHRFDT